jgi:hypothetical protein
LVADRQASSSSQNVRTTSSSAGVELQVGHTGCVGQIDTGSSVRQANRDVLDAIQDWSDNSCVVQGGFQRIGTSAAIEAIDVLQAVLEIACAVLNNRSREGVVASTTGELRTAILTRSERNSQLLCNLFVSQRLTRVLKPPKHPLPTTFLPQKAYFQSDRIFPLSFQRLSRITYLYRRNLQPIRRTNYLPTEAI